MFSRAVWREELCKQISLACVGSARSVSATLALSLLMACVLSWSTLLRLQVALQEYCLRWALGCVHFPGLSHSVQVLRHSTGADSVGPAFVLFPGPSSRGDQVLCECTLPEWGVHLITSRSQPLGNATSDVPCVSSGELISGCDPPAGCQPSRIPGRLG